MEKQAVEFLILLLLIRGIMLNGLFLGREMVQIQG